MKKVALVFAGVIGFVVIALLSIGYLHTYNTAKEFNTLEQAATEGNMEAQARIFEYYLNRDTQNLEEALKWANIAISNGNHVIHSHVPVIEEGILIFGKVIDYVELQTLADNQEVDKMFLLGGTLALGLGMEEDIEKAFVYIKPAAEAGHENAQYLLAVIYIIMCDEQSNEALCKDGVRWARVSANSGNKWAQELMAMQYLTGINLPKDYVESFKWASLAYEQGMATSALILGHFYISGMEGLEPDPEKALEPLLYAYNNGHVVAAIDLGAMYRDGNGVTKDANKALKYFEFAAARGDEGAAEEVTKLNGGLAEFK